MIVSVYELKTNSQQQQGKQKQIFRNVIRFESKISSNFEIYLGINMTEEMSAFEMYHKVKNTNGKRKHNGKKVKPEVSRFKFLVGSLEF